MIKNTLLHGFGYKNAYNFRNLHVVTQILQNELVEYK